ncbi:hypothetical protein [Aneurinibacillus migulanus]|uniref:Uncharacterized protein n=1 Tax=Aneurinibacillus migulanus TaxID=47500 RepID=A0A0D1Y861_ANEMI|nr:hypothetical protein [Aneurinibacillus migulanus]KIV55332.1 hypothetical protein TS65_16965 [Aneurinibacillus migulanus]KON96676.1 hypothetical protein AF333_15525 [Aneurinibacillus migulanus]MED0896474.1 hypothetical protein [Aneurinibacillus migulanus]MED1618226.1 hypothetical protein [Aneurinibacillus migulanus]SDJ85422.1 hypothetical protein SAMN04487909_13037 [Aneurinibacillus migulanus]
MKKRLIGGIVAATILIPTAAFAAPTPIEMIMTAEQVKADEVGKATLEKLYSAFPETKSFEIINASSAQGDVPAEKAKLMDPTNSTNLKVKQTNIVLQEKGGTGKKITLHTNGITGEIEHVIQENWEPKEKPLITLTDQEIKSKVDYLIDKMYGNIEEYEFAMEQMENPNQKTLMLNYIKKGSEAPFYQVFVQGNTISLSRIGGDPTPSNIKVEGLFSTNGKPDYTADAYLNDEKLFSLLKISPTELKQELAKGKSVVEIAASKNVSKQQVIDVIAETQVEVQIQAEQNGEIPKNNRSKEQMLKNIEPKVLQVIEHKTETPW